MALLLPTRTSACAVGAANTLWIENGRLKANNTDVEGFIGNVDASAPGWDKGLDPVLVSGVPRCAPCDGPICAVRFPRLFLLVNATSLGMKNEPALEIDLLAVPEHAVVTDLIYAPLETKPLATAKAREPGTVDELGMLLHQAVCLLSLWFGVLPQVTAALHTRVLANLAKS
jgi:shikimate dehydrogenase